MQPTLKDWLARKPKGKAKRKRIPATSTKRAKQLAIYRKKRAAYLFFHPYCEAWAIIWPSLAKHNPRSTEIHHCGGRIGEKLNDESLWLAVGRDAHNWIHAHPKEARAIGLLV
jgi:hypothetical protein